ncbi:GerAB/ArcD/ProY family transporter [Clostridium coskatii]|uniref:Spore germination protein YndE n=1 Tax=Clostridium coskatii TaxID=1705578 RepID=A0A166SRX9_9CLOT|nr:GerAB/ArcD/ProY family transporter [Clostridium coskatii]OAA92701.1 Spore germination protein YndE [Clostridium coskatii]OBR94627.1 spore germination protein YndE [Clostridium coskatii]
MREKEIITTNQFIWMLFCIVTSFSGLQVIRLLIFQARRNAWLSVILAWILDVLLAVVYAYMGIRFPGQNMVQYSITILGKKLGKIIGILFPIFFLLVSAVLQRSLSIILNMVFFPKTPVELLLISSYLVIAYAVFKGIEVIGRVSEILGPFFLFSLILFFSFAIPDIKLDRLKPQLEAGLYPALTGTPLILSFIGICIIMGMYIPICNHPENGFIAKFTAVSLGILIILMLVISTIGIFSYPQAKNMINISLELTRFVHLGQFFERVEAIWLMIVIGAAITASGSMIWAFSVGISQVAGLSTYKPLVFPAALLSFVIGITSFNNSLELVDFSFYSYPFLSIFVGTGLEIFLFFAALILKKKG